MNITVAPDRQKIIGLIAERNGIRVEKDDPVFAVATICQAYLEEAGRQIEASMSKHLTEFEAAVAKVQTRAGQLLAAECNDRVASIRSELQKDIVLAGAKANEIVFRAEQANRHPVMLRWAVLGTVVSLALLVLGLWIGARYLHT
jgi:CHASE3 domain sensor protein